MSSERKKQASRENGARSRGPVTPEGKIASSGNAGTHNHLSKTLVLDGESGTRFAALFASLLAEFQPRTPTEIALVENMAACRWRQIRLWGMEKAGITNEIRKQAQLPASSDSTDAAPADPPTRTVLAFSTLNDTHVMEMISRYETRYDRQCSRALRSLMQLRKYRQNAAAAQMPPHLE